MANTQKSLYRPEIQVFLNVLRELRERTGMNQTEFAMALGRTQTFVSAAERGAVRVDALQLRDWCAACGVTLVDWAMEVERTLPPVKKTSRKLTRTK